MARRKRILFFMSTLGGGGAERAVVTYCQYLNKEQFQLSLLLLNDVGNLKSQFPAGIPIDDLHKRSRWDVLGVLFRLRKVISVRTPDLIVSNLTYCNLLLLLAKRMFAISTPVIVIDHIHVSSAMRHIRHAYVRRWMIKYFYNYAVKVINVSQRGARDLIENFHIDEQKVECIYNPIDIESIEVRAQESHVVPAGIPENLPVILTVGRLTAQKDYPTLLYAFKTLLTTRKAFLIIVGEGEERESLELLADSLGIESHILFAGFQNNPYPFFRRAHCFVMSSLYEGFGIVLVEAMACGCPVVSTDCPAGPGEIIEDGNSGLLVPVGNALLLANQVLAVISDQSLSNKLKEGGIRRAADFHHLRIVEQYEHLFHFIINRYNS